MIAHEAFHVVDAVFEKIGHQQSSDNNEPGAYLIEWIVNKIMLELKKRNLLSELTIKTKIKT